MKQRTIIYALSLALVVVVSWMQASPTAVNASCFPI